MKRFRQLPDETNRVEHILFWLFPYEQGTFRRGRSRANRPVGNSGYVRTYQDSRRASRIGSR